MSSYSPKEYWTDLAERYRNEDGKGFAPVLHPGAPDWFNLRVHELQERAWRRALSLCTLPKGASVLDVGCGTGRWVRRYAQSGYSPVGLDGSLSMLKRAVELRTLAPLLAARLQSLPFRDGTFDCVQTITVIQHIPALEQQQALEELVRVIKPGGYLILLELIRGHAAHVVSHGAADWVDRVRICGPELISWFGQEFLFFDRILTRAVSLSKRMLVDSHADGLSLPVISQTRTKGEQLRRLYWKVRRITVGLSTWVEPMADRLCPAEWATHAVFVFRKPLAQP